MEMSWTFLSPLIVFITTILSDVLSGQVYRLPPYPTVTASKWGCVDVPTQLSVDDGIPLALVQYVNSTTALQFKEQQRLEDAKAIEYAKAHAIMQAYDPFCEFLFWLDNLYVTAKTILDPGCDLPFLYFDNARFANLFLKSAFHGIFESPLVTRREGSVSKELENFLNRLPSVVYASMANHSEGLQTVTNRQLEDAQTEKIFNLMNLLSNNSDVAKLVNQFSFNLQEINDTLEEVFGMMTSFGRPPTLNVTSSMFHIGTACLSSADNSDWPGNDIISALSNITILVGAHARTISRFVEDNIRDKVLSSIRHTRCTAVECWVRNPTTSIAWPTLNLSETVFGNSFFLYLVEGTNEEQPNLPILTPDWIKTDILENNRLRSVSELGTEINILASLYRYFEASYDFIAWYIQVKAYAVDIMATGGFESPQKFRKETFYQTFMELGLYLLERSNRSLQFHVDKIYDLSSDIFNHHFDLLLANERPQSSTSFYGTDLYYFNDVFDEFLTHSDLKDHIINKTSLLEIVMSFESSINSPTGEKKTYDPPEDDSTFSQIKQVKKLVMPSLQKTPDSVNKIIAELTGRLERMYDNISNVWSIQIQEGINSQTFSYTCDNCEVSDFFISNLTSVPSVVVQPCIQSWAVGANHEPVLREYILPTIANHYSSKISQEQSSTNQMRSPPQQLDGLFGKNKRLLQMTAFQILFEQILKYSFLLQNAQINLSNAEVMEGNSSKYVLSKFQKDYRLVGYQSLLTFSDNDFYEFLQYVGLTMIHDIFQGTGEQVQLDHSTVENVPPQYRLPSIDLNADSSTDGVRIKEMLLVTSEQLSNLERISVPVEYDEQVDLHKGITMSNVCPRVSGEDSVQAIVRDFNKDLLILATELEQYVHNVSKTVSHFNRFSNSTEGTTTDRGTQGIDEVNTTSPTDIDSPTPGNNDVTESQHSSNITEDTTTGGGMQGIDEVNPTSPTDIDSPTPGNNDVTESQHSSNITEAVRASLLPGVDTMALILSGDEDGKHVSLGFNAIEGTNFEGATKNDITFTLENVKSYKNQANIEVTVQSVTNNRLSIDVAVDISASWSLTMAVKGVTILDAASNSPLITNFKVEHSAPTIIRQGFTDSANAIQFEFDVPINVTRTADGGCGDFFQSVDTLGERAACDMKTPRLLVVTIGKGTDLINPDDVLTFKQDAIKPARQLYYEALNNDYTIAGPDNPPRPSFMIAGPKRINRCGAYELKAEQISGHGGRPISYVWQIISDVSPDSAFNSDFFKALNEDNGSPVLTIDAANLQPGQQYTFSLAVRNFLQEESRKEYTLSVIDDIKPILEIKPVNFIPDRIRVSSRVKLEAVVTYSFGDGCQSNENKPTYEWSSPDDVIPDHLKGNRVLVLPPNTLPADRSINISVTVTSNVASSNSATKMVTETIELTTRASPLVAEIVGASKLTLGPRDSVQLDGSRSTDPDVTSSRDLTYQWSCVSTTNNEACNNGWGDTLSASNVSVQASQLVPGSYMISLLVSKGTNTATATVTVIVTPDPVPVIKIKTRTDRSIKYRVDETVYIQASIISYSAITVSWSESSGRLNADFWDFGEIEQIPGTNEYRTHVKIPSDQTTPGSEYTIEIVATDQNGNVGVAAFDFTIYQTITQCEVQATSYVEMEEMTITSKNCVTDPDSEPLTYQPVFALPLNGRYKKIVLGSNKLESSQTVISTPIDYTANDVVVGFTVCDARSTCIDALTTTTYVSTPVLDDTARGKFLADKVDRELENGNIVTAYRNVINLGNMQKKSLPPEARRKKRDVFNDFAFVYEDDLDSVLIVLDDLEFNEDNILKSQFEEVGSKQAEVLERVGPTDSIEGAMVLDMSSQILQSTFTETNIDATLGAFKRILDTSTSEGFHHNPETMERMITTLGITDKNLKDTSTKEKRLEQRKNITDLKKAGLKQVGKGLNIGDHVTLNVSETKISIICFLPDNDTAINENADLPVKIRPGGSLTKRFTYDWCSNSEEVCTGLKAMIIQVVELEEEIKNCSELTDISLINPITDADVPVVDLEDPIEIEIATVQIEDGEACVCKFLDEETSRLKSDGVTSEMTADGRLVCKSTHLTTFVGEVTDASEASPGPATMQGATKTPPNGQLGLILAIVFGVLGVILLVILVGAVIFKVTQQKKVTPDGE